MKILLCGILMTSLTACGNVTTKEHFKATNTQGTEIREESSVYKSIEISSGVVGSDAENMTFQYNGEPIRFTYEWQTNETCKMGLKLYVEGIEQSYSVGGNETTLYTENVVGDKATRFDVTFTPNIGESGDTVNLLFANIYEPIILEISKQGTILFGNNQNISSPLFWHIQMNEDNKHEQETGRIKELSSTVVSQEEKDNKYVQKDNSGNVRNKLTYMTFELLQDDKVITNAILDGNKETRIRVLGGKEGDYRLSLHRNFEVSESEDGTYYDFHQEKEGCTEFRIPKDWLQSGENFYIMAIQTGEGSDWQKSDSFCIR